MRVPTQKKGGASAPSRKITTQTTRIDGKRVRIVTTTDKDGKTKVAVKDAPIKEWQGQESQVKALRALPEYGKRFLLAGDQNSAKRGPRAQVEAMATGMTPGEPDMRIYLANGAMRMFENKVGKSRLSQAQLDRHASLAKLGHHVEVVRFTTTDEAARLAVQLVRDWIGIETAANDNCEEKAKKIV